MDKLLKNKKLLAIIMITAILFARNAIGIIRGLPYVGANVLVDGLAFLYCIYLIIKDKSLIKKVLRSIPFIWIVLVTLMVFIYGYFRIGTCADYFSRQFLLLTMVPPMFILLILVDLGEFDEIISVLTWVGTVLAPVILIFSIIYDPYFDEWSSEYIVRAGSLPAGTVTDTSNLYTLLLIPMLYTIIVERAGKKITIFSTIVAFAGVLIGGSKAAIFPLVLVVAFMFIARSVDKKNLVRSLAVLLVLGVVGSVLMMKVPVLYDLFGYRVVEMVDQMSASEYDLHTSTGQRMAFTAEFKKHFGETPVFGHGFYSFKEMPYSQLEEYHKDGETLYRNIQLHNNFMEILFSYGIVGFILYYCFPLYLGIKAVCSKNRRLIILSVSFLVAVFFMDLGLDMYYKYLTPYYIYIVVYSVIIGFKRRLES